MSRFLSDYQHGHVLHVFSTSINLELNGKMVHVGSRPEVLSSFGCVPDTDLLNLIFEKVHPADLVTCRDHVIRIYGREIITLNLNQFEEIDLSLPCCKTWQLDIIEGLLRALQRLDLSKQMGIFEDEICLSHMNALCQSSTLQDSRTIEAVRYFWGRGVGLTPSGDDLLTGFLITLKWHDISESFESILKTFGFNQTTKVSEAYYRAAMNGYISYSIKELIEAAISRDEDQINFWINQLSALGHTSGYDLLMGIKLGLYHLQRRIKHGTSK